MMPETYLVSDYVAHWRGTSWLALKMTREEAVSEKDEIVYYLITNVDTYDSSAQEFTDWDAALDMYRDFIAAGIDAVLAQKVNIGEAVGG